MIGERAMFLLHKLTVVGSLVLCMILFLPRTVRGDAVTADSDMLSVLSLTGFNKDKQPILGEGVKLTLPEPGDKKDAGEKNMLAVPKIAFNFTELMDQPSDELTFDPFTIKFFSDLPADLPKGIKIVPLGTESTSKGLMLTYPVVEFKMDSESRREKKNTDESDTLHIVAATYDKTGTLDHGMEKKSRVLEDTIPKQALEILEPDGKTISDVIVIDDIKFTFESDDNDNLASNGGTKISESRANEAKLSQIISLRISSDADVNAPEPGMFWLMLSATLLLAYGLARSSKGEKREQNTPKTDV
jgi:hypothetical protein